MTVPSSASDAHTVGQTVMRDVLNRACFGDPMVICNGCCVVARMRPVSGVSAVVPHGWRFVRFTDTEHLLCADCLTAGDEWVREREKYDQRLHVDKPLPRPARLLDDGDDA